MKYPLIGLLFALISTSAIADIKDCDPAWERKGKCTTQPEPPPGSSAQADSASSSRSAAHAGANAEVGDTYAEGGDSASQAESSASGGNSTGASSNTSYESRYLAISRSMPQAVGCWGGADGGGAGGDGGGFLGIHLLNKDCFAQAVSEGYESVRIKARVECGSRWFRNAIAYDSPRQNRQSDCINFMQSEYRAAIDQSERDGEFILLQQRIESIERELINSETNRDTTIETLRNCREGHSRVEEAYFQCLQK